MRNGGGGNAIGGEMPVSDWLCLPVSVVLAGCLAAIAMRVGPRPAAGLRTMLVALLLPGLLLLFRADPVATAWHGRVSPLFCRAVGTLPLLVLPVLAALRRMPPNQVRAAAGLGAGPATRFRLLWLPQLGPACLAGLLLAGLFDAAALPHGRHAGAVLLSVPARPA